MNPETNLDTELRSDILDALEWADDVDGDVGVTVRHGVVTLTGHVERPADVLIIEQVARLVPGVRGVQTAIAVDSVLH